MHRHEHVLRAWLRVRLLAHPHAAGYTHERLHLDRSSFYLSTGFPAAIQPIVPRSRFATRSYPSAFKNRADPSDRVPLRHATSTSRHVGISASCTEIGRASCRERE